MDCNLAWRLSQARGEELSVNWVCGDAEGGRGGVRGAGLGDRLIVIRAALYMGHRKQRLLVQSVQDPFTFLQEQGERATPSKLLALQPQSRGPDEGSDDDRQQGDDEQGEKQGGEGEEGEESARESNGEGSGSSSGGSDEEWSGSDSDDGDARSVVDLQVAADEMWAPHQVRPHDVAVRATASVSD